MSEHPEALARERTLAAFYLPFLFRGGASALIDGMLSSGVIRAHLALVRAAEAFHHPLKACSVCINRSIQEFGWAYWRLSHQFPGSWICLEHEVPLGALKHDWNRTYRGGWQLPSEAILDAEWARRLSTKALEQLAQFACLIQVLVCLNRSVGWIAPDVLRPCLRLRLRELGWMTQGGSIRLKEAALDFLGVIDGLRTVKELAQFPTDPYGVAFRLGRMVENTGKKIHPIRYLLVIHWLFDDAADFVRGLAAAKGQA